MTRAEHMMIFLGLFAVLLALSHFYLWARISHYLQLSPAGRQHLALLLGGLGALALISLPVSRMLPREAASALAAVAFPWMGIILLLLVVMLATDLAWLLFNLLPSAPHDPARRLVIRRGFGFAALGATAVLSGTALWNGLRPAGVKPLTITLDRLPKAFDGLRIVQITDLHIGPMVGGDWVRRVVDQVNALKPASSP